MDAFFDLFNKTDLENINNLKLEKCLKYIKIKKILFIWLKFEVLFETRYRYIK